MKTSRTLLGSRSFLASVAAATAGVGGFAWVARRSRARTRENEVAVLRAYLLDHLAGSDADYALVDHLRQTHHGTTLGGLCEDLHNEFSGERAVVSAIVKALGGTTRSIKRSLSQAVGASTRAATPALTGGLPLFRAIESLAIGVQGKRLLWRALDRLSPDTTTAFRDLEEQAVQQWARLDEMRLAQAVDTFEATTPNGH